jgi:hypothetical protein
LDLKLARFFDSNHQVVLAEIDNQRINQSDLSQRSTRRVIRDFATGLFFAKGQWTAEPSMAQDFPDQDAIEKVVMEHQVKNAEMVLLQGPKHRVRGGGANSLSVKPL